MSCVAAGLGCITNDTFDRPRGVVACIPGKGTGGGPCNHVSCSGEINWVGCSGQLGWVPSRQLATMDGTALSDSIFQFIGSGVPSQGSTPNISVPATGGTDAAEGSEKEGDSGNDCTCSPGSGQDLQKRELVRAYVGSKVSGVCRG